MIPALCNSGVGPDCGLWQRAANLWFYRTRWRSSKRKPGM